MAMGKNHLLDFIIISKRFLTSAGSDGGLLDYAHPYNEAALGRSCSGGAWYQQCKYVMPKDGWLYILGMHEDRFWRAGVDNGCTINGVALRMIPDMSYDPGYGEHPSSGAIVGQHIGIYPVVKNDVVACFEDLTVAFYPYR